MEGLVFCLKTELFLRGSMWEIPCNLYLADVICTTRTSRTTWKGPLTTTLPAILCVTNEMRVLQLHLQVRCSLTRCDTSSYHTEISPIHHYTNRMNWKADLTTFIIRTSWSTQKHTHHDFHDLNKWWVLDNPHQLVTICKILYGFGDSLGVGRVQFS